MDTSDVIALGAFALSAVGAVIALWQAGIASRARADAQQARDDAAGHEQAALTASQKAADAATRSADEAKRSADALEEANALARAAMPTDRWSLSPGSGVRHSVMNVSGGLLTDVTVHGATEDDLERVSMEGKNPRDVQQGESVYFVVLQAWGLPPANVVVSSSTPSGILDKFTRTVD